MRVRERKTDSMDIDNSKKKEFVVEGLIFDRGRILLLKHKQLGKWFPPGGHVEANETPDEALVREVKEETGLDVEVVPKPDADRDNDVKRLANPAYIQVEDIQNTHYHVDLIYNCKVVGGKLMKNEESEDIRFFSRSELEKEKDAPKNVKALVKNL